MFFLKIKMTISGTDVEVTPWHGDIDGSRKAKALKKPSGILIITPESLESFLINRSAAVKTAFGGLRWPQKDMPSD